MREKFNPLTISVPYNIDIDKIKYYKGKLYNANKYLYQIVFLCFIILLLVIIIIIALFFE
jgi:hypothetical protein